jgi:nicotinate-nucleotide adenylyltransferase
LSVERWVLKIGIYGGTFDPIHHGHLILAREARERLGLDKLIFVPARIAPHKRAPFASAELRLSMLQAAVAGEKGLEVDDCELRRPPPSYTIDTVESVQARESDAEIYYLIGEDNLTGLANWRQFDRLQKIVRFVVLDRTGAEATHGYPIIARKIDISATGIRKRVASGQSIRYLVPESVEEIILRNNLYREAAQ